MDVTYLIDLEEGNLADLPGRVYIFGFIRNYSRLLNLDGEELIRRVSTFTALANHDSGQTSIPIPSQEEPSHMILGISAILIVAISIGGYFIFKPASRIEVPKADIIRSVASNHDNAEHASRDHGLQEMLEIQKDTAHLIEQKSIQLRNNDAQEIPKIIYPKDMPIVGVPNQQADKPTTSGDMATLKHTVVLKASEPSWVEVRDETHRIIFMRVMRKGEEYIVPDKPGITISTGNAAGLIIFVGSKQLPSLGGRGEVKRSIRVEDLQQ